MKKILAVARTEYFIAATSKAFIIGIVMMPIFMGGALAVQHFTSDQIDISTRKIAIVDESSRLFEVIQKRADERNENEVFVQIPDGEPQQVQAKFSVELVKSDVAEDERLDVTLTEKVRSGDIFAYAIIEEGVFDETGSASIRYHSQTPSYRTLPNWLEQVVNDEIKRTRTRELGLSEESLAVLSKQTPLQMFGLVTLSTDGKVTDAKEENRILTMAVPFAGLMLLFMMIMSVAPAMLNNVLEEKMQKISEFLVSSITPFQLMMGKLAGAVGIGMTLSAIYLIAAYVTTVYLGVSDRIPISLYFWFVFFLFIALVIFGSIFSAIGAACSEIKDAQSLMTPVMLLVVIPMMCMAPILDSPSSNFAKIASLIPPATPMLMFVRIAIPPGPALWEIALAVILSSLFAIGCVWAAGKIFRIGILSQGQAPSLAKMFRWVFLK